MISELQQEQASLYALGLLDADEATAFEQELAAEPTLQRLVHDLLETAAALALSTDGGAHVAPPGTLRTRVLEQIAQEQNSAASKLRVVESPVASGKVIHPRFSWVPWTVAAMLLGCCVLLGLDRESLRRRLETVSQAAATRPKLVPLGDSALSRVAFCELEPTPDAPMRPRAAVLWDATEHKGVLRLTHLNEPGAGKDYQLWAVEAARKEPVNAGVVHIDAEGSASVTFQPDAIPGDNKVQALAISLEEAGGSPTNKGPILFLGKL